MAEEGKRLRPLNKLLPLKTLQTIQDSYSKALGISSYIIDNQGNKLTEVSNCSNVCSILIKKGHIKAFIKKNIIDSVILDNKETHIFKIGQNINSFIIPIYIENNKLAYIVGGYIRLTNPNIKMSREEAKENNIDFERYLEYILELPLFTKERLEEAAKLMLLVSKTLTKQIQSTMKANKRADELTQFQTLLEEEIEQKNEYIELAEEKYKNLFNSIGDGIYQTDINGNFKIINKAGAEILGYTIKELIGSNAEKLYVHPQDRQDLLKKLHNKTHIKDYHSLIRKKDGTIIHIESDSNIVKDANGNYLGVDGVFRDITDRYLIDQQIKNSHNELNKILDLLPEGISIVDKSGKILFVNKKIIKLLKFKKTDLINKPIDILINSADITKTEIRNHLKDEKELTQFKLKIKNKYNIYLDAKISIKVMKYKNKDCYVIVIRPLDTESLINNVVNDVLGHNTVDDLCTSFLKNLNKKYSINKLRLCLFETDRKRLVLYKYNKRLIESNKEIFRLNNIKYSNLINNNKFINTDTSYFGEKLMKSEKIIYIPIKTFDKKIIGNVIMQLDKDKSLKIHQIQLVMKIASYLASAIQKNKYTTERKHNILTKLRSLMYKENKNKII